MATETHWFDSDGTKRRVRAAGKKLHFRNPSHAALRAFVYRRDSFTCVKCGWQPSEMPLVPELYTGEFTLTGPEIDGKRRELQLDHKIPRIDGGSNHPDNLQTLCFGCNASKQHRAN